MEHLTDPRNTSRDQRCNDAPKSTVAPRTHVRTKLRDILMSDKPKLSYADFHHELTRNPDDKELESTTRKEDELVRYMSNLPSYLEKGKNFQEKALNVGVLDWKRLEKWRSKKQTPQGQNGFSPASSNTSLFTTDGSSTYSSRGHSCSPAHQTVHHPELQSHSQKTQYTTRGKSQDIDVFGGNSGKFQDSIVTTGNNLSRRQKVFGELQKFERKESDLKPALEMGKGPTLHKYEVGAPWKGKTKIQSNESTKEVLIGSNRDCSERGKSEALIMPRDLSENSYPTESCSRNLGGVKISSQSSHTSINSTKTIHSPLKNIAQGVKGPSQASHMLPFHARLLRSPSKSRNTEEKKLVAGLKSPSAAKPSDELGLRKSSESNPKARTPSPIRRLSTAMGKMIKSAGSRDSSPLHRSSSKDCISKSGSEKPTTSSMSTNNPCSEKLSSNNNRGRSSPLRRFLDPLLKSRASTSTEQSRKHSSSTFGAMKSCNEQSDSQEYGKVSDPHNHSKNDFSSLQALLQVSFKNGLPLFTFAVDNESDMLAATLRKGSIQGKGHDSWIYTFFAVREIKRKSGNWLNQGRKGDGHGYVPNVVAQMKVSDSLGSFSKIENPDDNITREFDLFAVDVGHGDQYATDFHPTNELAAIVVNLQRTKSGNPSKDDLSSYNWLDSTQESRSGVEFDDNLQNRLSLECMNLRTTVILPGGVHTVPSKGDISTLAQRWRSGGSCDCGGWDLGCQLRVYANQREYERKIGSSVTCPNEQKFQLFSQVGQDRELVLSLAPFKERIYSVEFNSSLSLLQAFSISISFIDRRRPPELSEPSDVVGKISNEVGVFEVPTRMKTSNHQVETPAKYVSYPPYSPVGRV